MNKITNHLPTAELQALDAAHHMHPFTANAELAKKGVRVMTRAKGVWLTDSEGHRIIDGVAVPRDLVEQLALNQLLTVDKHHQLADVPAIESLVDRMAETLSDAELAQVLEGDSTPLQDEIRDPAVRAAVAAELKNEADLVVGQGARERETVEAYQAMARERQAELAAEHAAERGLDIEDGHEL